jgi:glycine/D-amino acid oxidase-like deaminating enzyme
VSLLAFLRRRPKRDEEIVVVGSGLPALVTAAELGRRSRRVSVLGLAGEEPSRGLGLVGLGPGRPYDVVAGVLGRDEARAIWWAGKENMAYLHDFLNRAGRDCGYEARGSFLLAASREEAGKLASSEDLLRDDEFAGEFLDHYMLETHFDVTGFAGAYWTGDGGDLDAARLEATAAAAAREMGSVFRPVRVRGLETTRSGVVVETDEGVVRASAAVVATDGMASGLWSDPSPRLLPTAPERLRLTVEEGALLPATARTADGCVAWQVAGSALTLASTGHRTGGGQGLRPAGLEAFAGRLPGRPAHRWAEAGEIPSDGLPVVGLLAGRPVAVACGFGPLAPSFVFAAARWVADALLTGRDPTPRSLRAGRTPAVGLV